MTSKRQVRPMSISRAQTRRGTMARVRRWVKVNLALFLVDLGEVVTDLIVMTWTVAVEKRILRFAQDDKSQFRAFGSKKCRCGNLTEYPGLKPFSEPWLIQG